MISLRMVADDLTGALDAGAPFAEALGPLPIVWELHPAGGSFVLDTESREQDTGLMQAALPVLAEAEIAYKKIDSLLRGRTVEEIGLCIRSDCFRTVVIAPAFPDQQRITRGGVQYWRKSPEEPWQAVPVDLRESVAALRVVSAAERLQGAGVFLCDAESQAELDAIAAAGRRLPGPLLWIGTAGLARALAGLPTARPSPRLERPLLIVVGSHHPVSLAQVDALQKQQPGRVARIELGQASDPSSAVDKLRAALDDEGVAALVIALPDGTGPAIAGPVFDRIFQAMARDLPRPRTLVVTGGATLMRLAQVLGVHALEVRGELMPGIAASRMEGGRWPGATVVSKSGAFGGPDLLVRLAAS